MDAKDWQNQIDRWLAAGRLADHFPEVTQLVGVQQHPEFHGEGDAFQHTIAAIDALNPQAEENVFLAVLLHDIGKRTTTQFIDGRWRSHGHAEKSAEAVEVCLERVGRLEVAADVGWLVRKHHFLDAWQYQLGQPLTNRQRRLTQHDLFPALLEVVEADQRGRIPQGDRKLAIVNWLRGGQG
jgi:hypothetical protein